MRMSIRSAVVGASRTIGISLVAGLALYVTTYAASSGWMGHSLGRSVNFSYQCITDTAVGPGGETVVAYIDEANGLANAAVRRAGAWSAARKIYAIPPDAPEEIIDVRVAYAADGTALAAFVLSHFEKGLAYSVVMASTLPSGAGTWTPAVEVSPRGSASAPRIFSTASGDAWLIWTESGSLREVLRTADGQWSAPRTIPDAPPRADVAMNATGSATLAWSTSITLGGVTTSVVHASHRDPGGTWSTPADVATADGFAYAIRAGIDGAGLASVQWMTWLGYGYGVVLAQEDTLGLWGAPSLLSDPGVSVSAADLRVDEGGDVAAVWSETDLALGEFRIHARILHASGAVEDQSWLTDGYYGPGTPTLAFSPDGSTIAIGWIDDVMAQAFAVSWTRALGWSPPAPLGGGLYQNTVSMAAGPGYTASAVWPVPTGTEFYIAFKAATWDIRFPTPVLSPVAPRIVRLSSGPLDLTVTGTGFALIPGITTILFDGAPRSTDAPSATSITGHLTAADLAAEGLHEIRASNPPPGGGTSKAAVPLLVDGTPPVTTLTLSGKSGGVGWYTGKVIASMTATDALTGIGSITSAIDADAPVTSVYPAGTTLAGLSAARAQSVTISGDRVHTIAFGAADQAGNSEAQRTAIIRIDGTAPLIRAAAQPRTIPGSPGSARPVTVTGAVTDLLSGIDPASLTYVVVDEYGTCQPAGTLVLMPAGEYAFTVVLETNRDAADADGRVYKIRIAARDVAGNARSASATVTVK